MWDFLLKLQSWFVVGFVVVLCALLALTIVAGLLHPKQPHEGDKADDEEEP